MIDGENCSSVESLFKEFAINFKFPDYKIAFIRGVWHASLLCSIFLSVKKTSFMYTITTKERLGFLVSLVFFDNKADRITKVTDKVLELTEVRHIPHYFFGMENEMVVP